MRNSTRRDVLKLSAAAVVLSAAPAIAAKISAGDDAAPLTMEREYVAARADLDKVSKLYTARARTLRESAQGGWPVIDKTMPHRPKGQMLLGDRLSLKDIRNFNRHTEAFASGAEDLLERKAKGRERIRWWIAQRRADMNARDSAGLPELEDRSEAIHEWLDELREGIATTPAHGPAGALVKLRVLIEEMEREDEYIWQMPYLTTAVETLERMEARNV